jgi:hypothetical protein
MLTFIRTGSSAPGRTVEAMTFAHQVAQMIEKLTGKKFTVSMPVAGNPARIAWISTCTDMAEHESVHKKLMSDAGYIKLVESAGPYFLPGSFHDELWSSI